MALVNMKTLLDHAQKESYAYPAFNVSNIEQIQAVFAAAKKTNSGVILQFSSSARKYFKDNFIKYIIKGIEEEYKDLPFCVHQDHGSSFEICKSAIEIGFTSVMIDGSLEEDGKTIASFDYNSSITKNVVEYARAKGVSVEGELGVIGSLETGKGEKEDGQGFENVASKKLLVTNPEEAAIFCQKTGVDALAVAIGTSHGAYKFSQKPTGEILKIDIIKDIVAKIGNTHIVMHGSSSVEQEYQDQINNHGGDIKQTYGVPIEEIKKAIKSGVRKINIDTDLRMAFTGAMRQFYSENKTNFDPRAALKTSMEAMSQVCEKRFIEFGTAGHGGLL